MKKLSIILSFLLILNTQARSLAVVDEHENCIIELMQELESTMSQEAFDVYTESYEYDELLQAKCSKYLS